MPVDVIMPALGMAQETGKVIRWLKLEGAAVTKDEPLVEVETDKVTVEVEAPADGTLAGICAAEGDEIPVGHVIAVVLGEGEELVASPEPSPPEVARAAARPRRLLASPKARRLAAARGIDLETMEGSGPSGALVASDLEAVAEDGAPPATTTPRRDALPPLDRVWRVMADRTTRSWQSVPHIWLRRAVDASQLQSWRAAAGASGHEGVHLTDLLVSVTAEALRRHPRVNSSWQDGNIVAGAAINVAIAVATAEGLVAPVVHGADSLDLAGIASRRAALVAAAREGQLRLADVEGGTFTISNLGMYDVDGFDAIVNAPQAAILAVGRIRDRVVPVNGHPTVRPTLELSLACDHRVVDGARGAEFLGTLALLIERPDALKS